MDPILAYLQGNPSYGIFDSSSPDGPFSRHGEGRGRFGDDPSGSYGHDPNPWRQRIEADRARWAGYHGMGSAGNELASAGVPVEIGQHLMRLARRGHLDELLGRINAGNAPAWLPRQFIRGQLNAEGTATVPGTRGLGSSIEGALGYLDDRYGQLRDLRQARNDARGGDQAQFMQALEAFKQYRQQLRQSERRGVQFGEVR